MFKQFFSLVFIFLVSISTLIFLQKKITSNNKEKREERLKKTHADAVDQFDRSMEHFAALMAGMRSFINQSDQIPSQVRLQEFLKNQLNQLNFQDSLVVSFLNENHRFIYSFTKNEIDPSGLVGKTVDQLRDSAAINRLNRLLKVDVLRVFPPINLVEGWMGVPLNFRVVKDGKVQGYIASLINLRGIITPIDLLADSKDFVLKFEVLGGSEFDRDQVFNGFKVYHDRIDSLSSRYVDIPAEKWVSSNITLFGQDFKVSTAYRNQKMENQYLNVIFFFFYLIIVGFSILSIHKSWVTIQLNKKLSLTNTKMQNQNQELQALNSTKDRFFSIIGHDLRGPLGTIINLMEVLNSKAISTQEAESLLKKLTPAAKNTVNLLEDLLRWAQINNDDISFDPEKTNPTEIIEASIDLVTPNAEVKGIRLVKQLEQIPDINLDKNMISTIIRNLVGNAIKFSKSNSEILIRSIQEDKKWVISIKDQGIGMSQNKINEITQSKHSSRLGTDGERGSGLGLTISIAFIKEHHGILDVQSTENIGSEFRVSIPMK